ncbi:hypothetical protein [Micromonospora sp. CPCC 206061]|uniref:hypothetical protein n=1 Tax=Micromonospora sp. CPCC 206061 TaxID=3122410 RepID=UPI002FF04B92
MKWLARAATVLTTLAAMVFTASPVTAGDDEWTRMRCLSGGIDVVSVTEAEFLVLKGHLDCADRGSGNATFAYARYGDSGPGSVFWFHLQPYAPIAPTEASVENMISPESNRFAVCLVTDYRVRIGCVMLTRNPGKQGEQAFTKTPLRPNSPYVSRSVDVTEYLVEGTPACGHCW